MSGQGTSLPFVKPQWFTNSGAPAAGYQLFTYAAGTTTKLSTYTDVDLTVANANPTILDASGRATVFLSPTSYKLVLALPTDTDPPLSPVWTQDNVQAIPVTQTAIDIQGTAGENVLAGQVCYLSEGLGSLTAGRWYLASNAAYYSSSGAVKLAFATADTLTGQRVTAFRTVGRVTGLTGLVGGTTYYIAATSGSITATEPASGTSRRVVGVADTTTSLVIDVPALRQRVFNSITVVGNVGAGEDTLYEYIAPAGELSADGNSYTLEVEGLNANNANAKVITVRVIEGANNNVLLAMSMTTGAALEWILRATIKRASSTTLNYNISALEGPANTITGKLGLNTDRAQTLTWANAVTIRVAGTGVNDNDIQVTGAQIFRRD